MITNEQSKILKKLLKNDWVPDVLTVLKSKNITSKNGKPYSEATLRAVMNGYHENKNIELAMLDVYTQRANCEKEFESKKKQLLSV